MDNPPPYSQPPSQYYPQAYSNPQYPQQAFGEAPQQQPYVYTNQQMPPQFYNANRIQPLPAQQPYVPHQYSASPSSDYHQQATYNTSVGGHRPQIYTQAVSPQHTTTVHVNTVNVQSNEKASYDRAVMLLLLGFLFPALWIYLFVITRKVSFKKTRLLGNYACLLAGLSIGVSFGIIVISVVIRLAVGARG